jgi:histidinol-phosphate aminotransferase
MTRWRSRLASSLELLGLTVRESPATFLLVKVGDAARITAHTRSQNDVRVRDGTSFGLRHWIRLSAQPPAAQKALLAALKGAL